ncbi:MAG: SdrD B-like domain-containing protein [Microthrixaceae bacterium]
MIISRQRDVRRRGFPGLAGGTGRIALSLLGAAAMLALGLSLVATLPSSDAGAAVSGTITGTVFRDYNGDGDLDSAVTTTAATDVGYVGATITAYDDTGAVAGTAVSGPGGAYSLAYTGPGAGPQVRLELTMPTGFRTTRKGIDAAPGAINGGTTVQFKENGGQAHFGIARPGDYSQDSPELVVPVHRGQVYQQNVLVGPDSPSLVSLDYGTTGTPGYGTAASDQRIQATVGQTGTVWGTATYGAGQVLTAALFKRHAPIGPSGLGAIYLTQIEKAGDAADPDASLFVRIPDVGTNPRGVAATAGDRDLPGYDWLYDAPAFTQVHKIGLGDIDLSGDLQTLYAVNLYRRSVYEVPINAPASVGGAPSAGTPSEIPLPLDLPGAAQGCTDDQVRPFGLDTGEGALWVTLTCTGPAQGDLRAYVYRYDTTAGTFGASPAFEASLDYPNRGLVLNTTFPPAMLDARWNPWNDNWEDDGPGPFGDNRTHDPQPTASDIEFDSNGDLSLAIKDRNGDLTSSGAGSNDTNNATLFEQFSGGELLRACGTPATGWTLESNGSCGARTGSGVGNNQGPGDGEFYEDDLAGFHDQTSLGATEQVPGFAQIVATGFDTAGNVNAGGYSKKNNSDGVALNGAELTNDPYYNSDVGAGSFAKADGIGDIEALLEPAPLEIGNRVWLDVDRDGQQDPNEAPIGGVTVHLYEGDTLVGTAVTDSEGEYYFNDANVDGGKLKPNTDYRIAIDEPGDYAGAGPLAKYRPTQPNAGAPDPLLDDTDSDGISPPGGFPEVSLTTGGPGDDDHTFDFGFVTKFDLALRKTTSATLVSVGDVVPFTVEVFNQGETVATDITVTDYLPADTTLAASGNDGWTLTGASTAAMTIPGPLAVGASTPITINLLITGAAARWDNMAEISRALDGGGNAVTDEDSTPDTDPGDPLVDDEIDNGGGDEDDHDIASVLPKPPPETTTSSTSSTSTSTTSTTTPASTTAPASSTTPAPSPTTDPSGVSPLTAVSATSTTSTTGPASATNLPPGGTSPTAVTVSVAPTDTTANAEVAGTDQSPTSAETLAKTGLSIASLVIAAFLLVVAGRVVQGRRRG